MIRCEDALRELWGYLCDEVTPESRALISTHLDVCRRCCGEVAFLGELQQVIASAAPELPDDVSVRMETFLATLEGGTDDRPDAQG